VSVRKSVIAVMGAALCLGGFAVAVSPASAATGGVDMQAACNNQYPGQGRIAKIRTWNVYGWKCTSGAVPVADGNIDVWRQCRAQHGANATGGYTNYSNPYSWYCSY
jgi:hypothetical protein